MNRQGRRLTNTSVMVALLLLVLALPWILRAGLGSGKGTYWTRILIMIAIMILATSSMRAIFRTGEMSLGAAGFMLLGGYGAALLCIKLGLSPWLTLLLGVSPEITVGSHTLTFGTKTNVEYYYLAVIVVGLCLLVLYRMEHSRIGLVWKSIREADNLAQSVGVNIMAQKIFIFVVACFFTGLAGGMYAFQ